MDRGVWRATVYGAAKSWTQLSTHTHRLTHTDSHTTNKLLSVSPVRLLLAVYLAIFITPRWRSFPLKSALAMALAIYLYED